MTDVAGDKVSNYIYGEVQLSTHLHPSWEEQRRLFGAVNVFGSSSPEVTKVQTFFTSAEVQMPGWKNTQ